MFEKEAEEYWYDSGSNEFDIGEVEKASKQSFIDGATFGYNKANEWHYVKDGDLPKPNIAVLICLQFEKWATTYIAYYRPAIKKWQMYNMHEAQRQPIVDDYIDSDEVIAWCEIPKFKEKKNG